MKEALKKLLEEVARGDLSPSEALDRLADLPYVDLGFARIDHHRFVRKHFPEVIYGAGKTYEQLAEIIKHFLARKIPLLVTKVDSKEARSLTEHFTELKFFPLSRILAYEPAPRPKKGNIFIVAGGTSDLPVVEEAQVVADYLGNRVQVLCDVGVAGLHRLLPELPRLRKARVLIVVAGMEGALASIVAGLVDRPVIAVPTSIGYGAHFGGLAPLLAMLNSCAPGIGVVNIDNGFGAAYLASLINQINDLSE